MSGLVLTAEMKSEMFGVRANVSPFNDDSAYYWFRLIIVSLLRTMLTCLCMLLIRPSIHSVTAMSILKFAVQTAHL